MSILTRNNVNIFGSSGGVLLYAHGLGCNQSMWSLVWTAFAQTYRQVLFDYVGSGQSDRATFSPERYASLHAYAQDVIEVCEALDLGGPVTFVGHSVSHRYHALAPLYVGDCLHQHLKESSLEVLDVAGHCGPHEPPRVGDSGHAELPRHGRLNGASRGP